MGGKGLVCQSLFKDICETRHALEEAHTFVVVVGVGGEELLGVVIRVDVYHSERVVQRRVLVATIFCVSVCTFVLVKQVN